MRFREVVTDGGKHYGVRFNCPGCGRPHVLPTQFTPADVEASARWTFNGDYERPTLSPSILARYDHLSAAKRREAEAYKAIHGKWPEPLDYDVHEICHSFVGINGAEPGWIIFLGDCTHRFANQVLPLPNLAVYDKWLDDFDDEEPLQPAQARPAFTWRKS